MRSLSLRFGLPRPPPKQMRAALEACAIGLERVENLAPMSRRHAAHHIEALMPLDASEFELGLALGLALTLFSERTLAVRADECPTYSPPLAPHGVGGPDHG